MYSHIVTSDSVMYSVITCLLHICAYINFVVCPLPTTNGQVSLSCLSFTSCIVYVPSFAARAHSII